VKDWSDMKLNEYWCDFSCSSIQGVSIKAQHFSEKY